MKLTVGTTLQDGKYLIQEIYPDQLSVTCRAIHTYLDQTVILQTFSEVVQRHNQFRQLQEQFLAKVRDLAKQSSSSPILILDYFKEGDLPFVVLKSSPEQLRQTSLPRLENWFSIPLDAATEPVQPQVPEDEVKVEPAPVTAPVFATTSFATTSATAETVQPNRQHPTSQTSQTSQTNGLRSPSHEPTRHVTVTVGGKRSPHAQTKPQAKEKPFGQMKPRLPIALMIIALVGGATGAGMGLAFRLSASQPGESSTPRLSFFDREQSFAPEGDWPVQEDEIYAPEPTIEEPLYRTSPPVEYSPLPQTLPSETTGWTDPYSTYETPFSPEAVEPIDPIDVPPVKNNPKLPEEEPSNLDTPVITESEPASDPAPLAEPFTPPPVIPQPVLPPIDAAPPESSIKPLPDNSLNIVSQ